MCQSRPNAAQQILAYSIPSQVQARQRRHITAAVADDTAVRMRAVGRYAAAIDREGARRGPIAVINPTRSRLLPQNFPGGQSNETSRRPRTAHPARRIDKQSCALAA